jgi:tryptophan synthase alpha chain
MPDLIPGPSPEPASRPPFERSARRVLESRRGRGGRGLIPFLTAGFPDWGLFDETVRTLADSGADVLELGIPFSDPLADGPTIQASSQRALEAGVTVEEILQRVERGARAWGLPVVFMTYANPVLAYGAERFARRAREAGVAGMLVSDLPPEELPELWDAFRAHDLECAVLIAPTTTAERIPLLARAATAYVYCITRTGVTGRGGAFAGNLDEQVKRVRGCTELPVVAGFGIRSPEDAALLSPMLDGVVVGARWIELLSGASRAQALRGIRDLASGLRRVLDGGP